MMENSLGYSFWVSSYKDDLPNKVCCFVVESKLNLGYGSCVQAELEKLGITKLVVEHHQARTSILVSLISIVDTVIDSIQFIS